MKTIFNNIWIAVSVFALFAVSCKSDDSGSGSTGNTANTKLVINNTAGLEDAQIKIVADSAGTNFNLLTTQLAQGTNTLTLDYNRPGFQNYTLTVSKAGYDTYSQKFTQEEFSQKQITGLEFDFIPKGILITTDLAQIGTNQFNIFSSTSTGNYTIDWGDGTSTARNITVTGTNIFLVNPHTYNDGKTEHTIIVTGNIDNIDFIDVAGTGGIKELNVELATALTGIKANDNTILKEVDLSKNTKLGTNTSTKIGCNSPARNCNELNFSNNNLYTINLTGATQIKTLDVENNQNLPALNISFNTKLTKVNAKKCLVLNKVIFPNTNTLTNVDLTNCSITTPAQIDEILSHFDGLNAQNGFLLMKGPSMASPNGDYNNVNFVSLRNKGWTILTNTTSTQ